MIKTQSTISSSLFRVNYILMYVIHLLCGEIVDCRLLQQWKSLHHFSKFQNGLNWLRKKWVNTRKRHSTTSISTTSSLQCDLRHKAQNESFEKMFNSLVARKHVQYICAWHYIINIIFISLPLLWLLLSPFIVYARACVCVLVCAVKISIFSTNI